MDMNIPDPLGQINFEEDSVIVVKFMGNGSSNFQIFPSNVSPAQFLMIGEVLRIQGEEKIREATTINLNKRLVDEALARIVNLLDEEKNPQIAVAKGQVLKPNAK